MKKLYYDVLTTLLVEIQETLNSRPMTCLSDEQNDDANTWSQLLYERNISKQNLMHINYRERIAENTEQ